MKIEKEMLEEKWQKNFQEKREILAKFFKISSSQVLKLHCECDIHYSVVIGKEKKAYSLIPKENIQDYEKNPNFDKKIQYGEYYIMEEKKEFAEDYS